MGSIVTPIFAICPLCLASSAEAFFGPWLEGVNGRSHLLCPRCRLIFAWPRSAPDPEEERSRYLLHRNDIDDPGYVRFLRGLWNPVHQRLSAGMRGLDYGCGPRPILAELVRRAGFACAAYDPLFPEASEKSESAGSFDSPFDFVLCSEVFEHFDQVGEEITRLLARLRPGGILGVMTELWTTTESFARWAYTSDPTHRAFYHARTFDWIRRRFALDLLHSDGERVVILRRGKGDTAFASAPTGPETPPG